MTQLKFNNFSEFYYFILENISDYDFNFIRNLKNGENYSLVKIETEPEIEITLKQLSTGKYVYLNEENTKEINIEVDYISIESFFTRYIKINSIHNENEENIKDFIFNSNKIKDIFITETYNDKLLRVVFIFENEKVIIYLSLFEDFIMDSDIISDLKYSKKVLNKIKKYLIKLMSKNIFFTF